jgi:hypothetical protein
LRFRGSIPAEVQEKLLGSIKASNSIKGKWSLENDKIRLTGISADEKAIHGETELHIYRTGPIRVDIGSSQYVFGWSPTFE